VLLRSARARPSTGLQVREYWPPLVLLAPAPVSRQDAHRRPRSSAIGPALQVSLIRSIALRGLLGILGVAHVKKDGSRDGARHWRRRPLVHPLPSRIGSVAELDRDA
jgi:hypothetical protein